MHGSHYCVGTVQAAKQQADNRAATALLDSQEQPADGITENGAEAQADLELQHGGVP